MPGGSRLHNGREAAALKNRSTNGDDTSKPTASGPWLQVKVSLVSKPGHVSPEVTWTLINLATYLVVFLLVGLGVAAWIRRGRQLDRIEQQLRGRSQDEDRNLP